MIQPFPPAEVLGCPVDEPEETGFVVAHGQRGRQGETGPIGPAGGATIRKTAGEILSGHRMVRTDGAVNVVYADSSVRMMDRTTTLGLTLGAADLGADVDVQRSGEVTFSGWNWIEGPVFLGALGQLTQTLAPGTLFSLIVGFAESPTTLYLDIGVPITLAQEA